MLYNEAWKKKSVTEVRPDISMGDFIAWLEIKNPNETYNYQDRTGQCCLGQYMAARGIEWPKDPFNWGPTYKAVSYAAGGDGSHVAFQFVLSGDHRKLTTFGETLTRARAYQKSMENA